MALLILLFIWIACFILNIALPLNGNLYVCGDFNTDFLKCDMESKTKYFIDHFLSMSLYPLINKPTHIKHGYHTINDNIFTNVSYKGLSSGEINDDLSDQIKNILHTDFFFF